MSTTFIDAVDRWVRLDLSQFVAPLARGDLFELTVAVVLSQNTSDRNAIRAFRNLKERLGRITPEAVLSLAEGELAELIKPAGMYNTRARYIKAAARFFQRGELTPSRLIEMGVEKARALLLSVPGVGKKTADVILANVGLPAFPVDTHIARIARRWGVGGRYEEVGRWFMERIPPERYLELHLKLIQFGREVCRARGPRCGICPIGQRCPSYRQ